MRAVVQRVAWAKVAVGGQVVGAIDRGLLVYLGVGKGDDDRARAYVLGKVGGLRIFADDGGKMNRSVTDVGGSLLIVSQFTLYADVRRGKRPSFDGAMDPGPAERIYERFVEEARAYGPVAAGRFGAAMEVSSLSDGPVTILVDSAESG